MAMGNEPCQPIAIRKHLAKFMHQHLIREFTNDVALSQGDAGGDEKGI